MKQKFKVVPRKDPRNPNGNPKYYPTPVYSGTYSINDLSKYIANISTVSEIDVAAVLQAFVKVFPDVLQQGNRIDLEGLGVFSLGFATTASEKADDVTANNVEKCKLKYTPAYTLKKEIENATVEKA